MNQYLADSTSRSNHILEHRKYLIKLLDDLFPDQDINQFVATINDINENKSKKDLDTIEAGLYTLSQYIHKWGVKKSGAWSTPFSLT